MSAEDKLSAILIKLNGEVLSKSVASRLVGGRAELYRLIEHGKIRVEKKNNVQNGKWYCNASDVLQSVRG